MEKLKGLLLAATIMLGQNVMAQTFAETALLFSRTKPAGSARIMGTGGAQVGLGGDYSSAFSNPAGLGMYNKSEFSLSPATYNLTTRGDYFAGDDLLSSGNLDSKSGISIPGFGIVFSKDQGRSNGFICGSFGITLSRMNDFNSGISYNGSNSSSSLTDYFIEDASGLYPADLSEGGDFYDTPTGLAYSNYLIEDSTFFGPGYSPTAYHSIIGTFPGDPYGVRTVFQEEQIKTSGAQNQWNFSYGANFADKIFIGAGIGFPSIRYESSKVYRESNIDFDQKQDFNPVDNLELREDLKISGRGINATVGIIGRPGDFIQLGISYNSPTAYSLTDTYTASMSTGWNNFDYFQDGSPNLNDVTEETEPVVSEYTLKTPGKLNVGATVFLNKAGFVTGDAELVNYDQAKYSSQVSGISYDGDNTDIKKLYQPIVNYKLGGELRMKSFRFRGGFNYMPDPFRTEQNGVKQSLQTASAGLGYRASKYFIDLAYINSWGNHSYRPYTINSVDSPLLKYSQNTSSVMATVGFNF